MGIFYNLSKLIYRKEDTYANPLNIGDEDIEILRSLSKTPGYKHYVELLSRLVNVRGEVLLASTGEDLITERGRILGIRQAASFVEMLLQEDENERKRSATIEQRAERAAEWSRTGTVNTPFYTYK